MIYWDYNKHTESLQSKKDLLIAKQQFINDDRYALLLSLKFRCDSDNFMRTFDDYIKGLENGYMEI
jgi:hypothetical protein